ncbi:MAG: M42 family metallopeptidase [Acholeplasmataceae bacterium]|nr:M42 family metallopeptidase [Acholeplasmataceae bacterium]
MKLDPIYQKLMESFGISSREEAIKKIFKAEISKYPEYEIVSDNLGSIFAYKKAPNPDARTVVVAGHMDEVGLMISEIRQNGAIKVIPIGGQNALVYLSQVVFVQTEDKQIPGVIGAIPPHIRKDQPVSFADLIVDVGLKSRDEVLAQGIEIGQMVLPKTPFLYTVDQTKVIAKAVDNRWGCAMAIELIRDLASKEFEFNLAIGATVQEEVGLRGAGTITFKLKPDMFIALDASPLNDINDPHAIGKMDEGFLIRLYDPSNIMKPSLFKYFKDLAKKHELKHQIYFSKGGTDAARALTTREGVVATTIGLPTRYIHSTAAMFSLKDHQSAHQMIRVLLNDLSNEIIDYLKTN